ncbi:MAG: hypothetical protein RL141_1015 [Candidatus Parcubacteria bacterium]
MAGHRFVAALVAGNLAGIAGVEVVLAAMLTHHLAGSGKAEAFGHGLVRLEFHRIIFDPRWPSNCWPAVGRVDRGKGDRSVGERRRMFRYAAWPGLREPFHGRGA